MNLNQMIQIQNQCFAGDGIFSHQQLKQHGKDLNLVDIPGSQPISILC